MFFTWTELKGISWLSGRLCSLSGVRRAVPGEAVLLGCWELQRLTGNISNLRTTTDSKNSPGTPQTVIQVVNAVVVEVFGQRLDGEADNDGGDDNDHGDDDDDWQVEEVAAFRILNTGGSLLNIIQDLALHHF